MFHKYKAVLIALCIGLSLSFGAHAQTSLPTPVTSWHVTAFRVDAWPSESVSRTNSLSIAEGTPLVGLKLPIDLSADWRDPLAALRPQRCIVEPFYAGIGTMTIRRLP